MRYQQIPGMASEASVIVLGCAWFGSTISEDESFALLDAFVERGGNFLDTAHGYMRWTPGGEGKSETALGKWLSGGRRDDVLVATKGADAGMERDVIRSQMDESLDRLQSDHVDFYWLHADDVGVPAGEIIDWMNEFVDEGRTPAFGCSNWKPVRIREANAYAADNGKRGFSASQLGWSLGRVNDAVRTAGGQQFMDDETYAFHRETGLAQVGYSSQAGGFFGPKYAPGGPPPGLEPNPNILKYYASEANYARRAAAGELAAVKGCSVNQVALAYLANQPAFPGFAIVGAGTLDYLADACGAGDIVLTPEEVDTLGRAHLEAT